jgi:hypothetical protein
VVKALAGDLLHANERYISEVLMKVRIHSLGSLLALAFALGVFSFTQLYAQQSPSQSAPPSAPPGQTQQPSQPPDQSAQDQGQSSSPGSQIFTGPIVKSGDKYVLQDTAHGTTYDLDHQDQVKKFEGKKVRVSGVLDSSGKMIHIQ